MTFRTAWWAAALLALAACADRSPLPTPASPASKTPAVTGRAGGEVTVKILAFNDFHGNLLPPSGKVPGVTGPVGGAAYLAAHLRRLGAGRPNTVIVAAGDLIGGSPLTSSLFHDEPTIEVMNAIGLDVLGVGNHEFDEGIGELVRMKKGGCHPQDGCNVAPTFSGARFEILGANVFDAKTGARVLPPYVVRELEGIPVGFIGLTLEGTPRVVVPSGVAGLSFRDEAKTIASLVDELRGKGVEAIVVVVHEGGLVRGGGLDDCNSFHGPMAKLAERIHPAVDVIVSGHTHALYNCRIQGRPVTSALSFGRVVTEIDMTLDRKTRDVVRAEAKNRAVTHDVEPDPAVQAIVDRAATLAAPREKRVIGRIAQTLRADAGASGESPLASVIADAQLEATRTIGADIAILNLGGVRADLVFARSEGESEDGIVTYGEAFIAQPFANVLVTFTLTGGELSTLIESELHGSSVPQVSSGTTYRWSASRRKLLSLSIAGKPIAPDTKVRLTTNNFVADTSPVLKKVEDRTVGPVDLDALEAYFAKSRVVEAPKAPRIVKEP